MNRGAKHTDDERLKRLTKIGIYNPKFNIAYILDTSKLTPAKFIEVEYQVIGYGVEESDFSKIFDDR